MDTNNVLFSNQATPAPASQGAPVIPDMVPANATATMPANASAAAADNDPVHGAAAPVAAPPQAPGASDDSDDDVPLAMRTTNGAKLQARAVQDDNDSDDELPLLARAKQQPRASNGAARAPKRKAPEPSPAPKRARTSTGNDDKPIKWNTLEHAGVWVYTIHLGSLDEHTTFFFSLTIRTLHGASSSTLSRPGAVPARIRTAAQRLEDAVRRQARRPHP